MPRGPPPQIGLRRLAGRREPRSESLYDDTRIGLLADALFDAVFVHVDGRIVEVNRAFETTFGYTAEEALDLTVFDIIAAEHHDLLVERVQTQSEDRYELVGVTKSGEGRHMEVCGRTIPYRGGTARVVAIHDVTDRRLAEEQVGVLAFQYAADLTAVSEVARRLPRTADAAGARQAICEGALAVCDGMIAVLMEPDGTGHLVSTAVAGADAAPMRVPLDATGSATARVFVTGEPFFVADLTGEQGLSRRVVDATGAVSALWQPVLQDGEPVGVLLVSWDRGLAHLSDRAAAVVGLFAAEAAVAIERADTLARLDDLNGRLARQIEALRLSDQMKSDFVSSVSHELRTPLASILGYLEILSTGEVGDLTELQRDFLGIVDTNAHRLLALIDELLTLAGLESGKLSMRFETVDLGELVLGAVQVERPALWSAGRRSTCRCPIRGSRSRLTSTGSGRWSAICSPTPSSSRRRAAGSRSASPSRTAWPSSSSRTRGSASPRTTWEGCSSGSSGPRARPSRPSRAPASASPSRRASSTRTGAPSPS